MNLLIVSLTENHENIAWSIHSDDGLTESGTVTNLTELAELSHDKKVIAWLSAELVTLMNVEVPAGHIRHLDKMLPALLEDRVATDIDLLHFSIGGKPVDGKVTVAIIDKSIMQYWLDTFADANIQLQAMIPESLALPWQKETWTINIENKRAYLRWSEHGALVCDLANLSTTLLLQTTAIGSPKSVQIYAAEQPVNLSIDLESEYRGEAMNLGQQQPDVYATEINLLQGDFRLQSSIQKQWKMWRPAAIIAAIALTLQLASISVETWQLNQEADKYRSEVKQVFQQTFPDEKRIVNAKVQMSQRLEKLQKHNTSFGFLAVMQQLVPSFQKAKGISVAQINFDKNRNEMKLDVKAANYAQIELFTKQVVQSGLQAELGTVSGNKGAYTARIIVRGKK